MNKALENILEFMGGKECVQWKDDPWMNGTVGALFLR